MDTLSGQAIGVCFYNVANMRSWLRRAISDLNHLLQTPGGREKKPCTINWAQVMKLTWTDTSGLGMFETTDVR